MQQTISVNGVTVERKIVQNFVKNSSRYWIDKKWKEFKKENNLKLKKAEIIQFFEKESKIRAEIRSSRPHSLDVRFQKWQKDRFLMIYHRKQELKSRWETKISEAISLSEALVKNFKTAWYGGSTYIKIGDNLARVSWSTESDWNYYASSYNMPKNIYSDRRVDLFATPKIYVKTNSYEVMYEYQLLKSYYVDSFRGHFLLDAIVKFFNIRKSIVWVKHKEIRKIMLNPYFRITLRREIAGVKIYERTLAGHFVDYCAVADNETYHSDSMLSAVSGLKSKIKNRKKIESEIITKQTGFELGFCEIGMKNFCDDNNIDINSEITRKELRNIVLENRTSNCEKYRSELKKLGIMLNCK